MKGRLRPVDYLGWALTVPAQARFDLTGSGVPDTCGPGSLVGREGVGEDEPPGLPGPDWAPDLALADLCRRDHRPELHADFLRVVAARYGVAPECVVPTLGASQAIPHVLFALARPGDHVIVERPTYEPLHRVPEMLGLSVSRLERKIEEGWSPLPDRLARLLTPKTRAVILTNLHNPTGVAMRTETLVAIGEMAARVGAAVLVDEVYLDFAFDSSGETQPWRPAAVAIDNGVSWSSTTKCFGFSALRAGWVVTRDLELAQALRASALYFHVDTPLASLALATRVMRHAPELAARANRSIERVRTVVDRWIASEPRVTWIPPSAGQTGLVRLPDLMQDLVFAQHLRERYDTQVVPGAMFEAPGAVRLSFNLPLEVLEQALANFSAALDDLA
ncbi:aminotransferase class I/II-fold pyridoxal phosphate-dependent enzyme [Nannocystaceae bacterium ST9]